MGRGSDEQEDRRARNRSRLGILSVLALVVAVFVATMAYGAWSIGHVFDPNMSGR